MEINEVIDRVTSFEKKFRESEKKRYKESKKNSNWYHKVLNKLSKSPSTSFSIFGQYLINLVPMTSWILGALKQGMTEEEINLIREYGINI